MVRWGGSGLRLRPGRPTIRTREESTEGVYRYLYLKLCILFPGVEVDGAHQSHRGVCCRVIAAI